LGHVQPGRRRADLMGFQKFRQDAQVAELDAAPDQSVLSRPPIQVDFHGASPLYFRDDISKLIYQK
jgi:hypothetical protein